MSLAAAQESFMALVLDYELPLPQDWSPRHGEGMAIYRNAYRARLIDALRDSFPLAARHAGDEAFSRAAAHHLITRPPCSWTLDDAGEGFAETLGALFAHDPEVAELGWLEWAMHRAFVARDTAPLTALEFASQTSGFADEDWERFALAFLPGTAVRCIEHDIAALWRGLSSEDGPVPEAVRLAAPQALLVWREGLKPVFRQTSESEAVMLAALLQGDSYGTACAILADKLGDEAAAAEAGVLLGNWLRDGLIAAIRC